VEGADTTGYFTQACGLRFGAANQHLHAGELLAI
jgi:hypothetical protein